MASHPFVRMGPTHAHDTTSVGGNRHASVIAKGCIANALPTSPCSKATKARVSPQVGHGTPRIRFMGHSTTPNTCASVTQATMRPTAKTQRAASEANSLRHATRNRTTPPPFTKPAALRRRELRWRDCRHPSPRRNRPPHTWPRSCNTRTAGSQERQCHRQLRQGSRAARPQTTPG